MPLSVTISGPLPGGGTDTYVLRVESITHRIGRGPAQLGLPGVLASGAPNIKLIDLGAVMAEVITIEGTVNRDANEDGATDPSKIELEDAAKTWWTGSSSDTYVTLTISLGEIVASVYDCQMRDVSFTVRGAQEDRFHFTMAFVVRARTAP